MQTFKIALTLGSIVAGSALGGCASTSNNPSLPRGSAAYQVIPPTVPVPNAYPVRPKDKLTLRVFNEPDISQDELRVDDVGMIQIPLIGSVKAEGRSVDELSSDIAARLGTRYIKNPQVAVSVKEPAPSYVSVEGEVEKPGVYEIDGRTTLLAALARAESPTATAKLNEIVVFRTINDQRMVARFNLKEIRVGLTPDPMILDGDVVMVGYSRSKGLWQDILKTAPIFNAFAVVATR
ncbi:polysaccharide biosynthesis/export family protein [Novosphingobium resinovorum]|uniref:polysaccharide biosynthesis/export family protein n=1 Tax=Novosphingobium TaxID=165696 RepID=UPI001B3C5546|nr:MULTISPECIES: polysaccharide biosynthesis/export family protein [Novosphingobium]MBF7012805.1 polysaccharide export protein [Novosphingobium sp. HR1a]WJM27542.1 polysaccharide biosynthesis/export family protein [Novosphingobium resinovorum]